MIYTDLSERLLQLDRQVNQAEHFLEREIGEAKAIARRVQDGQRVIVDLEDKADALQEVSGLLNRFADAKQVEVVSKVEGLVTHGLQTIFGDDLSFHVVQEIKRGRVETRFVVRSMFAGAELETAVMDSRGGGVAAVTGFLLRLIVLLLQPDRTHFMVLDESFSQVSSQYAAKFIEFVRELVDKTSVQLLIVTHTSVEEWLEVADKAYEFTLKSGKTVVRELTEDADSHVEDDNEPV